MKYIKKFERVGALYNKKTVDFSKIYAMEFNGNVDIVGKIIPNPGIRVRDRGCILIGYTPNGENKVSYKVQNTTWNYIRLATPEEIEQYDLSDKTSKYNL